jgi:GAF domain-containing protein/CheY-like chemotaxis protein
MSKQKQLHNRLDTLFSELEREAAPSSTHIAALPGWTWECDSQGNYIACSAEVEAVLGFDPESFVGQPLNEFHLAPQSAQVLSNILDNGDFPIEIILYFQAYDGEHLPVRTHITTIDTDGGKPAGLHGFTQVVESQVEILPQSVTSPTSETTSLKPETLTTPPTHLKTSEKKPPSIPSLLRQGQPLGIAAEEYGLETVSTPFTPAGEQSLQKRQSITHVGSTDSPGALAVPVNLQDQALGLLEIVDETPGRLWSEDELRLVEEIADQLSLALENARLFEAQQLRAQEMAELHNISLELAQQQLDLEFVLDTITQRSMALVDSDGGGIWLWDPEEQDLALAINHLGENVANRNLRINPDEGLTGLAYNEGKIQIVDVYDTWTYKPDIFDEIQFSAALAAPIVWQNQVMGVLFLGRNRRGYPYSENEQNLVELLVNQGAAIIQSANLFKQTQQLLISEQRRRQIADTMSVIAHVVGSSLDLEEVSQRLLEELARLTIFDRGSLQIIEGDMRRLVGFYTPGDPISTRTEKDTPQPISKDILAQELLKNKQVLVISDTRNDPRWDIHSPTEQVRSWVAAPLLVEEEVVGMLTLEHLQPDAFDADTIELLHAISAQASVAIQNARLFQQVQHRSVQLQTAAEVARAASSILDPNPLIQQTVNLIQERFDLYYAGLFLIDQTGEFTGDPGHWAVLRAGTGEAGRIQVERRHKLEISGDSMIGLCIRNAEAQISQQATEESARYANPLLPETRSEMALPLVSRGQVIGAMTIQSTQEDAFSEEDITILRTLADQVANALQNASLFDQTQARAEELNVLNEMSRALAASLDPDTIVQNIYLFTSRLIDTSTFLVALYDQDTNWLTFPMVIDENRQISIPARNLETGMTEYVIRTRQPLLIYDDVEGWLQDNQIPLRLHGSLPQSWLGVPMTFADQAIGIISVQHTSPQHFNEHHRDLLVAIASQSAIAIQNATLFKQIQLSLRDTETLYSITRVASGTLELETVLDQVLAQVMNAIGFEVGLISMVDPSSDKLSLLTHRNLPEAIFQKLSADGGMDGTICDLVYRRKETIILNDLSKDPPIDISGMMNFGLRSYIGVPLESKGRVLGTISTFSSNTRTLQETDITMLNAVGQQIGVSIENANLFEESRQQAERLAVLNLMSRDLTSLLDQDAIVDTVWQYTSQLMDTTNFYISLSDQENNRISFPLTINDGERINAPSRPMGEGLTDYIIRTGETLLLREKVTEQMEKLGIAFVPLGDDRPPLSYLGVPMAIGNNIIGVIAVQSTDTPRLYNPGHRDTLTSIASQAAISIQNARLFSQTQEAIAETRQRVNDLTLVSNISQSLASAPLDPRQVAEILVRQFVETMGVPEASVSLLQENNTMEVVADIYLVEDGTETKTREIEQTWLLYEYPASEKVLTDQKPLIVNASDPNADPAELAYMEAANTKTLIILPMAVKGRTIGVIEIESTDEEISFSQEQLNLATTMANQAAVALENAQLYEEQRTITDQLRELDSLKSQFLANMSHELRTPLNSIIGFSRVIMKGIDGPVSDLQKQDLSAIYNAGQHLLNMINDILDISKIEAGKMEFAFEDIYLPDLIQSMMSTARGLVKDKDIELITKVPEDLPLVYADPTRVRQVLLNLLSNAAKFTEEGSITVTAQTQQNRSNDPEVIVSVIDTGEGIADEDRAKLFQPFSQVDGSPTRKTGGTGLGLSISRLLVEMHGGEIDVVSEAGKGSNFFFTLPLAKPNTHDDRDYRKTTILAIENDERITALYQRYLDSIGFEVVPLLDLDEAVETAKQLNPFAITLDIAPEDQGGWRVLEQLKADVETHHIPVIICSLLEETEKGLNMGAADFLKKPILQQDIVDAIKRLGESKTRMEK